MIIPNDIARCPGVGSDADGWRDGCEDCQRRTEPGDSPHMAPPPIIVFECERIIAKAIPKALRTPPKD